MPLKPSSVPRLSYIYDYANNLDQEYSFINGIQYFTSPHNTPRRLQFSMRLKILI
jgi:hypothetical protein